MLEQTSEYEYFSKFALLDDGIEFLRQPNQRKKSFLDAASAKKPMHFCTCNKEYISESTFWVPEKIYAFGKEFISERKGEFTKSEYELLLYELNRLWRER
jgi:HJR/Mrr/RecB family endonuclease